MGTFIVAAIITFVILAASLASPRFNNQLYSKSIFEPIKAKPEDYKLQTINGIPRKDFYFPSANGKKLHAYYFDNPGSTEVFLFSHSNWGNVDQWSPLIKQLLNTGTSVFAYDYQGFGLSEGTPSLKNACEDGLAAFDYLARIPSMGTKKIVLCGSSLGCAVASVTAKARKGHYAGVVFHAAFSSLRDLTTSMIPVTRFIPHFFFFRPDCDNCRNLSQVEAPLLLIHGQDDELVPCHQPQKLLAAAGAKSKSLIFLPGSSHMDTHSEENIFQRALFQFLASI